MALFNYLYKFSETFSPKMPKIKAFTGSRIDNFTNSFYISEKLRNANLVLKEPTNYSRDFEL